MLAKLMNMKSFKFTPKHFNYSKWTLVPKVFKKLFKNKLITSGVYDIVYQNLIWGSMWIIEDYLI